MDDKYLCQHHHPLDDDDVPRSLFSSSAPAALHSTVQRGSAFIIKSSSNCHSRFHCNGHFTAVCYANPPSTKTVTTISQRPPLRGSLSLNCELITPFEQQQRPPTSGGTSSSYPFCGISVATLICSLLPTDDDDPWTVIRNLRRMVIK